MSTTKVTQPVIDLNGVAAATNVSALKMPAGGAFSGTPAEAMMRCDNSLTSQGSTSVMQHYTGNSEWKPFVNLPKVITVDYLIVGGGGGGAGSASNNTNAGGGGAGGLLTTTTFSGSESVFSASLGTSYTVEVGPGGAGTSGYDLNGVSGTASKFGTVGSEITAAGGGGAGTYRGVPQSGGSGGGAGSYNDASQSTPGAASPAGQGNAGGAGMAYNAGGTTSGGGGGGAGAAGSAGSGGNAGAGGVGLEVNIIGGTGNFYAGGGGGGGETSGGSGGNGGGGAGASSNGSGSAGSNNYGGGGGGATSVFGGPYSGGNGGTGVVILRYTTADVSSFSVTGTLNTPTAVPDGSHSSITFTTGTGTITFS